MSELFESKRFSAAADNAIGGGITAESLHHEDAVSKHQGIREHGRPGMNALAQVAVGALAGFDYTWKKFDPDNGVFDHATLSSEWSGMRNQSAAAAQALRDDWQTTAEIVANQPNRRALPTNPEEWKIPSTLASLNSVEHDALIKHNAISAGLRTIEDNLSVVPPTKENLVSMLSAKGGLPDLKAVGISRVQEMPEAVGLYNSSVGNVTKELHGLNFYRNETATYNKIAGMNMVLGLAVAVAGEDLLDGSILKDRTKSVLTYGVDLGAAMGGAMASRRIGIGKMVAAQLAAHFIESFAFETEVKDK